MASRDSGIIAIDKFILATRDSGYKSTTSAVSELVDNAIQAGAGHVEIALQPSDDADYPIEVIVADDGCGMDARTLRQALRFGGSSRFDDRSGLGRYGMGLPNASLSQARRVEVWSWRSRSRPLYSYLDVDEIARGEYTEVPRPVRRKLPTSPAPMPTTGTVVRWLRCDRLDNRRISTLARKTGSLLGRVYRHYLWDGVTITVNGELVVPFDPLYVREESAVNGGMIFEEPLEFEMRAPGGQGTGLIVVQFSELPVAAWHGLENSEKRRLGVINGAGVSIVRAGREVDFGWFFMGGKRKENYDDWWRCEVRFDPILDEAFGITHTKQQIRPSEDLRDVLDGSLERIAKILNSRVRDAHAKIKTDATSAGTETLVTTSFARLKPLPRARNGRADSAIAQRLVKKHRVPQSTVKDGHVPMVYRVIEDRLDDGAFFAPVYSNGHALTVVNQRHPFYKQFYRLLNECSTLPVEEVRHVIQVLLMAAVRAEGMMTRASDREAVARFRKIWGDSVAATLNGKK